MSVLLQISDPHFGTEQPPVVAALLALVERLRPDVCLLSGDITQRARRNQFAAARRFVDRLAPARVLVIPGNHDIPLFDLPARLCWPYRNFRTAFGDALEAELASDDLLVLALNTTRPRRRKHGEVSPEQVERVARRLRDAPVDQLRIVVTHQPAAVPDPRETHNLLRGRDQALRPWAEAGADLLVGGHIHLPYVIDLRARLGLPRRLWCVQAGTATSHRTRAGLPNSVNLIRYDHHLMPWQCRIERWDHNAVTGAFECVQAERLLLDRH